MTETHSTGVDPVVDAAVADLAKKGWSHQQAAVDPSDVTGIQRLFESFDRSVRVNPDIAPEISLVSPQDFATTLARSREKISFHTDNVYLARPCAVVVLYCVAQANSGGENVVVDGLALARALPAHVRTALGERQWRWMNPVTGRPSADHAVLGENERSIRWWRESLLNDDRQSKVIADTLEDALDASEGKRSVMLRPGEVLVVDNTRMLHLRHPFSGPRELYRARFW